MTQNRTPGFLKHRTPILLLILGATAALAAGGVTAYWLVAQQRPTVSSLPAGSTVVPQDALATLTVSTEPDQWQQLRQFGTVETQDVLDQNLAQLRDRFLTAYGYDYQRDIQPWVGKEATVALLSTPPAAPTASPQPESQDTLSPPPQPIAIILPIADANQARTLLTASQPGGNRQWRLRDYKGIEIRDTEAAGDRVVVAVLDAQFLVVTTDQASIERIVDTYRGANSVAGTPGYRQAVAQVASTEPFLRIYINAPVARAIANATSIQPLPFQGLSPLRNKQGIAATFTLQPGGIQMQGLGWLAADGEQRYQTKNTAGSIPNLLPDNTLMMVSGGNLQQFWQDYSQQPIDPKSPVDPANVRQTLQDATGLNLEQDLLPWMDGEFGLALIPITGQPNLQKTAGVLLMVKTSDRPAAEQAFKQLDATVSERYRFNVSLENVGGQPVTKWVSPFAGLTVTHGWVNGDVAFLALGAPVASTILPKPGVALTQSDPFKKATFTGLNPNNGSFFVDLDRLVNTENAIPMPQFPRPGQIFLKAIRAIGVTAAIPDDRSIRYDIQVLLQKTNNSRPLPAPSIPADASPSP